MYLDFRRVVPFQAMDREEITRPPLKLLHAVDNFLIQTAFSDWLMNFACHARATLFLVAIWFIRRSRKAVAFGLDEWDDYKIGAHIQLMLKDLHIIQHEELRFDFSSLGFAVMPSKGVVCHMDSSYSCFK